MNNTYVKINRGAYCDVRAVSQLCAHYNSEPIDMVGTTTIQCYCNKTDLGFRVSPKKKQPINKSLVEHVNNRYQVNSIWRLKQYKRREF